MTVRLALALLVLALAAPSSPAAPPSPSEFLGMTIGADRTVADYRQIASYFRALDEASPRVTVIDLGPTTLGNPMLMAVITSEANQRNLDSIRATSAALADPRGLSDAQVETMIREGKVIVLVTCNIHSTEIASSQMAMEWAHALATAEDEATRRRLENVVLLLVPSLNPDGQIMETEWYRKYLGTKYEGGRMPWLYHHYVGHDNNRDWFMLTQNETRHLSRALYHEWFPQIFVDEHQMGQLGPRMFIPPFADPVDPDVHPLIWREINLIGSNMAFRLEQEQKAGVIYGYSFDAYWLGGTRNTGWWKNITGLLLEVASARMATPIEVAPTELRGGSKGLVDYKAQINHPNPWKGGVWRMRDIMDYERIASDALLEIASERREDFLRNLVTRARAATADAKPREAYRIPKGQRDAATARRLAHLMADHGVEVIEAGNGDYWIPLAQPYSRFVREMLEPQRYPEVRLVAGADILRPYDVATWTLPAMMGVVVEKTVMPAFVDGAKKVEAPVVRGERLPAAVDAPLADAPWYAILPRSAENARVVNEALRAGGSVRVGREVARDIMQAPVPFELPVGTIYLDGRAARAVRTLASRVGVELLPLTEAPANAAALRAPRIGVYKPWIASMDEGWTRWLLEENGFKVETLDPAAVRSGGAARLRERFDAIILPDIDRTLLATGRPRRSDRTMSYVQELPPEYQASGLENEGAAALRGFVEAGGTLLAFDSASEWVIEHFNVPVRNALAGVTAEEFSNPGSLVRVHIDTGHPVTASMPADTALFLDDPIAFETVPPAAGTRRWVLATYPEDGRDALVSGWMRGAERLERRAAAVAMTHGRGKIVLFGFRPQHRGQTHATFPMLWGALWWSVE